MTMMLTKDGRNALSVEVLRQVPLECMSNTQLAQWNLLVKKGEPPKDKDPDAVRNALSRFNATPGLHRATSLGSKAVSRIARGNARKERKEEGVGGERQQTATTKDRRPPVCGKEDVKMTTMTMGGLPSSYACSKLSEYQLAAQMGLGVGAYRKMLAKEKLRKQQAEAKAEPVNGTDAARAFQEGQASFEADAASIEPEPESRVATMTKRLSEWAAGTASRKPEPEPEPVHRDRADAVSRGLTVRSADLPSKVLHDVEGKMDDDGIDRGRLIQLAHVIEGLPSPLRRDPGMFTSALMSFVRRELVPTHYMVRGGGGNGMGMTVYQGAKVKEVCLTGYGLICWGWGMRQGTKAVVATPKRAAELHAVLTAEPVVCRDVDFGRRVAPKDVARALCHWMDGATPGEAYRKVRDHEQSKTRDDWDYGGAGVVLPGSRTHQVVQPKPEPELVPEPEEVEQALATAVAQEDESTEDRLARARDDVEACKEMLADAEARVAELEVLVKVEAEEAAKAAAEAAAKAEEEARKARLIELLGSGMGIEEALKAL